MLPPVLQGSSDMTEKYLYWIRKGRYWYSIVKANYDIRALLKIRISSLFCSDSQINRGSLAQIQRYNYNLSVADVQCYTINFIIVPFPNSRCSNAPLKLQRELKSFCQRTPEVQKLFFLVLVSHLKTGDRSQLWSMLLVKSRIKIAWKESAFGWVKYNCRRRTVAFSDWWRQLFI